MLAIPCGRHRRRGIMEEVMKGYCLFDAVLAHSYQRLICTETYIVITRYERHGNVETTNGMPLEQFAVGGFVEVDVLV